MPKLKKITFLKYMMLDEYALEEFASLHTVVKREMLKGAYLYAYLSPSEVQGREVVDLDLENGNMIYAVKRSDIEISDVKG